MNRLIKIIGILVVGIILLLPAAGMAAIEDAEVCTISITMGTLAYGVTMTTPTISFANVVLDSTNVYTAGVSTVTNSGDIISDWKIKGEKVSASTWTLVHAGGKDVVGENQATLCAILTPVATYDVKNSSFTDADVIQAAGAVANMTTTGFAEGADGDNVPAAGVRRLWFRLHTPSSTTSDDEQKFKITIEAHPSSAF
ncbi:MAG: hypothetical protein ABIH89_03140 [Elusimicrobiota bacterium]